MAPGPGSVTPTPQATSSTQAHPKPVPQPAQSSPIQEQAHGYYAVTNPVFEFIAQNCTQLCKGFANTAASVIHKASPTLSKQDKQPLLVQTAGKIAHSMPTAAKNYLAAFATSVACLSYSQHSWFGYATTWLALPLILSGKFLHDLTRPAGKSAQQVTEDIAKITIQVKKLAHAHFVSPMTTGTVAGDAHGRAQTNQINFEQDVDTAVTTHLVKPPSPQGMKHVEAALTSTLHDSLLWGARYVISFRFLPWCVSFVGPEIQAPTWWISLTFTTIALAAYSFRAPKQARKDEYLTQQFKEELSRLAKDDFSSQPAQLEAFLSELDKLNESAILSKNPLASPAATQPDAEGGKEHIDNKAGAPAATGSNKPKQTGKPEALPTAAAAPAASASRDTTSARRKKAVATEPADGTQTDPGEVSDTPGATPLLPPGITAPASASSSSSSSASASRAHSGATGFTSTAPIPDYADDPRYLAMLASVGDPSSDPQILGPIVQLLFQIRQTRGYLLNTSDPATQQFCSNQVNALIGKGYQLLNPAGLAPSAPSVQSTFAPNFYVNDRREQEIEAALSNRSIAQPVRETLRRVLLNVKQTRATLAETGDSSWSNAIDQYLTLGMSKVTEALSSSGGAQSMGPGPGPASGWSFAPLATGTHSLASRTVTPLPAPNLSAGTGFQHPTARASSHASFPTPLSEFHPTGTVSGFSLDTLTDLSSSVQGLDSMSQPGSRFASVQLSFPPFLAASSFSAASSSAPAQGTATVTELGSDDEEPVETAPAAAKPAAAPPSRQKSASSTNGGTGASQSANPWTRMSEQIEQSAVPIAHLMAQMDRTAAQPGPAQSTRQTSAAKPAAGKAQPATAQKPAAGAAAQPNQAQSTGQTSAAKPAAGKAQPSAAQKPAAVAAAQPKQAQSTAQPPAAKPAAQAVAAAQLRQTQSQPQHTAQPPAQKPAAGKAQPPAVQSASRSAPAAPPSRQQGPGPASQPVAELDENDEPIDGLPTEGGDLELVFDQPETDGDLELAAQEQVEEFDQS